MWRGREVIAPFQDDKCSLLSRLAVSVNEVVTGVGLELPAEVSGGLVGGVGVGVGVSVGGGLELTSPLLVLLTADCSSPQSALASLTDHTARPGHYHSQADSGGNERTHFRSCDGRKKRN